MDSKEFCHNLSLSEIEFLPAKVLELLGRYNIFTLDQLLSATRGLTRVNVFNDQENKEDIINKLLQFIPEDIIQKYRDFTEEHPTGLIIQPKNENDSEHLK
jgi:hypothetical protein